MNNEVKEPIILQKLNQTIELIDRLNGILQPVLSSSLSGETDNKPSVNSLVLVKLDNINYRLEGLCKLIDIN